MKTIASIVLIILAIVMIYIGTTKGILPPALTGIGFLAISIVFLTTTNNNV
jgi:hypothetical protein